MHLPIRFSLPVRMTVRAILLGAALLGAPFATTTAAAAPCTITTDPASVTVCAADTGDVTFTCAWSSTGHAAWYVNNVLAWTDPANGASTSTYHHAGSTTASIYCVWDSGPCTPQTSKTATLTVNTPATISANPTPIARCAGGTAIFTVTAAGSPAPTYQWKKGNTALADVAGQISGSKTATVTLSNIDTTDAGNYKCTVSNACGNDTSAVAALTVNTLSITTQPTPVTTCAGIDVVFSIAATGSSTPTYQWKKGTTILTNGNGVLGATTNQLKLTSVDSTDAGSYSCVVSAPGACSALTSTAVALSVNAAPSIQQQPRAGFACSGSTYSFRVQATGTPTPTYRWQKNQSDLNNITGKISGATSAILTISGTGAADVASYRCIITNTCGTVTSDEVSLQVTNGLPTIITQPHPINSCNGDGVFSVQAGGIGLRYFWEVQDIYNFPYDWYGFEGDDPPYVTGSDTATITFSHFFNQDAVVRCIVDGPCGSVASKGAYVFTTFSPVIQVQPQDSPACAGGEPALFGVEISEASDPYYTAQWQWLPAGAASWLNLVPGNNSYLGSPRLLASGVDTTELAVTPLASSASAAQFRCILAETDTCVTTSLPASLLLCVSDLDCNGLVDDADFSIFLGAYNILDCADPTMSAGCPSDLNRDGVVDDADFSIFVVAYDALLCFSAAY
ncbi:MAG: immunoglobulin domain-containing protein [Planctomycetes bacterium]|nr:immunoglobulin domain-containing protein [Planctomycetota bacterium]